MRSKTESGFSFIDVMIAVTILLLGILAFGAAMTGALVKTQEDEQELVAKQYATSTIEAIFSARDVYGRNDKGGPNPGLGFDTAQNVKAGGPGIFVTGRQAIYSDDGPDNITGTADDTGTAVVGFQRQIDIQNVNDANDDGKDDTTGLPVSLRRVTVTVYYNVNRIQRQVDVTTLIGDYNYLN